MQKGQLATNDANINTV